MEFIHFLTNEVDAYIIPATPCLELLDGHLMARKGFSAMAGKSTAWLRTAAPVLIALGLVGCLWALIGLYQGLSPAPLSISAVSTVTSSPPPSPTSWAPTVTLPPSASPTGQSTLAPLPLAFSTRQPTLTPLPLAFPIRQPTLTPLPLASPTRQPTPTPPPPATPPLSAALTTTAVEVSSQQVVPEKGALAPDFSLPNAQGGTFILSDLRGERKVVLVFFHSVC